MPIVSDPCSKVKDIRNWIHITIADDNLNKEVATWSGGDSPSGNQRTQVQVFPNIPDDLSYIWDSSLYMKLNLRCQDMVSMKFQRKCLTLWKTINISGLLKFLTHLENMKALTVDFQMVFLWWELLPSYGFHWKWTGIFASHF